MSAHNPPPDVPQKPHRPDGAAPAAVQRTVVHGDALTWLRQHPQQPGCSVLASIPDVSELGVPFETWEAWFAQAIRLSLQAAAPDGLCCFFQTDIRHDGRWISKGGHVLRVAAAENMALLWHKIVCRTPPNTTSRARAGYSHLFAFSKEVRIPTGRASPDVLPDRGAVPWPNSMGTRAAIRVMRDVRSFSPQTHTIIQPFCGIGTGLVIANEHGFHTIGIERNRRRATQAQSLDRDAIQAAAEKRTRRRSARYQNAPQK